MDCSAPGFPVHHQLVELAQPHVHQVGYAIQPSHPLLSPSPSAFSLSQHQGLFQWVSSSYQVAKVLEFQLQHQSFQWRLRISFRMDWLDLLAVQGTLKSSPTPQFKSINSLALSFLQSQLKLRLNFWLYHILTLWPQRSFLASLSLCLFICKMELHYYLTLWVFWWGFRETVHVTLTAACLAWSQHSMPWTVFAALVITVFSYIPGPVNGGFSTQSKLMLSRDAQRNAGLWGGCELGAEISLTSHPAGVDVWRSHGGHSLLQGGPYLQEVRALQGACWSQPGPGKLVASLGGERLACDFSRSEAPHALGLVVSRCEDVHHPHPPRNSLMVQRLRLPSFHC